jgi:endonuclease-3
MSTPSRSELIAKTFRILKKRFKRRPTPGDRTVLEHLLFACCQENATPAQADEAFGKLQTFYFDWNEVRVTTISELTEVMGKISDAPDAARRLRYCLHHVFESHYSFDIDDLKKLTIGKAIKQLKSYQGITPFVISYVVQQGLGGHTIPLNNGALRAFTILGIVSGRDAKKNRVPGLERAIAKNRGSEFGDLAHQLGVTMENSPYGKVIQETLLGINPEVRDRLPKRPSKEQTAETKTGTKKTVPSKTSRKKSEASKTASGRSKKPGSKKSTTRKLSRKKPR